MRRTVRHQARGARQAHMNRQKYDPNRYTKENERLPDAVLRTMTSLCCRRCCEVVQWKVDYGHFIALTHARRCNACARQTVVLAYHRICQDCARTMARCAKCQKSPLLRQQQQQQQQQQHGASAAATANTTHVTAVTAAALSSSSTSSAHDDSDSDDNDSDDDGVPVTATSTSRYAFVDDEPDDAALRPLRGLDTRALARQLRAQAAQAAHEQLERMRERERRTVLRQAQRHRHGSGDGGSAITHAGCRHHHDDDDDMTMSDSDVSL